MCMDFAQYLTLLQSSERAASASSSDSAAAKGVVELRHRQVVAFLSAAAVRNFGAKPMSCGGIEGPAGVLPLEFVTLAACRARAGRNGSRRSAFQEQALSYEMKIGRVENPSAVP